MNEITILIIGIGIGYFWAMYRKDNIEVVNHIHITSGFVDFCIKAREQANQSQKEKLSHV